MSRTIAALAAVPLVLALGACASTPALAGSDADEPYLTIEEFMNTYDPVPATADQRAEIERDTARCMRDAGFDEVGSLFDPSLSDDDLSASAWAEKNGYGIAIALDSPAEPDPAEQASPSGTDADAYADALWGDEDAPGCFAEARAALLGPSFAGDPRFDAIGAALSDHLGSVERSPELADARAAWASCMADAGWDDLLTFDDARQIAEAAAGWLTGGDRPAFDSPEVQEFLAFERELAITDVDCREQPSVAALIEKGTAERDAAFYAAHREDLEALLQAAIDATQ